MFDYIRAVCAVPNLSVGDPALNTEKILEKMQEAAAKDADLAVFPELCLTGYTCGDLFFQTQLLECVKKCLVRLAEESRRYDFAVLIGAPLAIGGQLYKQIHKFFGAADNHAGMRGFEIARKLEQEAKELGVEFWLNTVAYGIFKEGVGIVRDGDNFIVKAKKVIVAAGGIENTTAFPGSTLPGVMLAGAAQTMTNIHRVLPGKRMVVVGSGNVGLIVAYQMLQAGAEVLAVVERDDHIGGYGVHAEKIRTAGVPILTDTIARR